MIFSPDRNGNPLVGFFAKRKTQLKIEMDSRKMDTRNAQTISF